MEAGPGLFLENTTSDWSGVRAEAECVLRCGMWLQSHQVGATSWEGGLHTDSPLVSYVVVLELVVTRTRTHARKHTHTTGF